MRKGLRRSMLSVKGVRRRGREEREREIDWGGER